MTSRTSAGRVSKTWKARGKLCPERARLGQFGQGANRFGRKQAGGTNHVMLAEKIESLAGGAKTDPLALFQGLVRRKSEITDHIARGQSGQSSQLEAGANIGKVSDPCTRFLKTVADAEQVKPVVAAASHLL